MKALKGKDLGDGITWTGVVMKEGWMKGRLFVEFQYT
jgi:hypothetical protein